MVDFHLKEGEEGVEEGASEVEVGQILCQEERVDAVVGVEGREGSAMDKMAMECH